MSRAVTLAGYAAVLAGALALEIGARWGGRVATAGQAARALLEARVVRMILLAGWLWVGWHLFVRVHS